MRPCRSDKLFIGFFYGNISLQLWHFTINVLFQLFLSRQVSGYISIRLSHVHNYFIDTLRVEIWRIETLLLYHFMSPFTTKYKCILQTDRNYHTRSLSKTSTNAQLLQ